MIIPGIVAGALLATPVPPDPGPAPEVPDLVYHGSYSGADFIIEDVPIGEATPHRWLWIIWSKSKTAGTAAIGNANAQVDFGEGAGNQPLHFLNGTGSNARTVAYGGIYAPTGETVTITIDQSSASSCHVHVYTCSTPIIHHMVVTGAGAYSQPVLENGQIIAALGVRNSAALDIDGLDTVYTALVNNHRGTLGHQEFLADGTFNSATASGTTVAMGSLSFRGFSPEHKAFRCHGGFGSTHTYSDIYLGPDAVDRLIIMTVGWWSGSTATRNNTSATYDIGGGDVAFTSAGKLGGNTARGVSIYYATIPAGATATIKINFSDTTGQSMINIFAKTGLLSATPSFSVSGNNQTCEVADGSFGVQATYRSGTPLGFNSADFNINNQMTPGTYSYGALSKNFTAANLSEPCATAEAQTNILTVIWT